MHNFEGEGMGAPKMLPLDRSIMYIVFSIGTPTYLNAVHIIFFFPVEHGYFYWNTNISD